MSAMRERYGVEGIVYLAVLALAMVLTIGFAAGGFIFARDSKVESDTTRLLVAHVCAAAQEAFGDSNQHVRAPLRQLLTDAAYARQVASETETGKRARVDAATAEKYRILATQVTTLPSLTC